MNIDVAFKKILPIHFTEGLAESASQFRVSARRLERQIWWKNCKVRDTMTCYQTVTTLFLFSYIIVKGRGSRDHHRHSGHSYM